jgi:hypothetical protein
MGLLDDGNAGVQKVLRCRPQRLSTYEALGQCSVKPGRRQVADSVVSRVLHGRGWVTSNGSECPSFSHFHAKPSSAGARRVAIISVCTRPTFLSVTLPPDWRRSTR